MSQFARPISDIANSGWAPSTGSDLWACLDEQTANDLTDYVEATADGSVFTVLLSPLTDPVSASGHTFRWKAFFEHDHLSAGTQKQLLVELLEGASVITSNLFTLTVGSWASGSKLLDSAEANSISDYTDLRLRFTFLVQGYTSPVCRVTWGEFQVPAGRALNMPALSRAWTAPAITFSSGAGGTDTANLPALSRHWSAPAVTFHSPGTGEEPRRRFVSASAASTFTWEYDDYGAIPSTFLPFRTWRGDSLVDYGLFSIWGQVDGLEAVAEYNDRPDLNPPDGLTGLPDAFFEMRWKFRLLFRARRGVRALGRSFGSGSVIAGHSDWAYTAWYVGSNYGRLTSAPFGGNQWRQVAGFIGNHPTVALALHDAAGTVNAEENYELTERLSIRAPIDSDLNDPGWEWKRARPLEDLHITSWAVTAIVLGNAYAYGYDENDPTYWSTHGGSVWWLSQLPFPFGADHYALVSHPLTASGAASGADTAGHTQELANQDYGWSYDFAGLGFHLPLRAVYNPSDDSIRSTYGSFDTSRGKSRLHGNPHECAFEWSGSDGLDVSYHQAPPPGELWTRGTPPAASLGALPSWALSASASVWDYISGAAINARLQHRLWGTTALGADREDSLIGEWDANDPYRYPVSGDLHWLLTNCDDGVAFRGGFAGPSLTVGYSWPAVGSVTGAVSEMNLLLEPRLADRQAPYGTVLYNYFIIKHAYADATLHDFMRSGNRFLRGRTPYGERRKIDWLHTQQTPFFEVGRLSLDATHRFAGLFNEPAKWGQQTNTDYTGTVSVEVAADGLKFTVSGAPALASTRGAAVLYRLRYFAYRYAHLRIKCSTASAPLKFGLGTLVGPGGGLMPARAWDLTLGGAGSWVTLDLDLARPDKQGKMPSSPFLSGFGYLAAPTDYFHPAEAWAQDGLDVWLDFGQDGDYTVEYLDGYHLTTGSRTPMLFIQPMEVFGTQMQAQEYELLESDPFPSGYVARWITNGVLSADLISDYAVLSGNGSFAGWWDFLFSLMDDAANDTGVHITKGTHALKVIPHIDDWKIADLPYGVSLASEKVFQGALRLYYPRAYYGMGNPVTKVYGRTIACRLEQVVKGELLAMVPGGGATFALHDNDTGAVVVSGSDDDDGLLRLPAPNGVPRPFDNETESAQYVPGAPITYTTLGLLMNAYWLKATGTSADLDGSGYVTVGAGGTRMDVGILDRFAEILQLPRTGTALNPRNFQDWQGRYHTVEVRNGNVWYSRSDFGTPARGYAVQTQVSGRGGAATRSQITFAGEDAYPVVAVDPVRHEPIILWQGPSDVWISRSQDDGETWEAAEVAIAGAVFPGIWPGSDRSLMISGVVSGNVYLRRQEPGDPALGTAFLMVDQDGIAIPVEEDTVGLSQTWGEGAARWTAHLNVLGEGATSTWESSEDGLSWSRVV